MDLVSLPGTFYMVVDGISCLGELMPPVALMKTQRFGLVLTTLSTR
jgi:hypothetical protein